MRSVAGSAPKTRPTTSTASGWTDYLATGTGTDGDFGLYRWHMAGPPGGPGPHFHRSLSEFFRVHDTYWVE